MPIYFLLQVLQVKYASGSPELCINLCVSTKSVENIFCFCARGCVAVEDVAGGLLLGKIIRDTLDATTATTYINFSL
jgi:hypothetical protein